MEFMNKRFSVIRSPIEIPKPKKGIKKVKDPSEPSITFDNLKYKFTKFYIEVYVDGTMNGVTKGSGRVVVRQDYGPNAFGSAVTSAQDMAIKKLESL